MDSKNMAFFATRKSIQYDTEKPANMYDDNFSKPKKTAYSDQLMLIEPVSILPHDIKARSSLPLLNLQKSQSLAKFEGQKTLQSEQDSTNF